MRAVIRSVLAVLAGSIVAGILIALVEMLGHQIYAPPPGIDPTDPESLRTAMESMPVGALVAVLIAWAIGTFAGSWLAARIAGRAGLAHGMGVGLLMLAAGVANMLMIPHPVWFWCLGVAVFPLAAWLGGRMVAGR
jgi:hypothetical protein